MDSRAIKVVLDTNVFVSALLWDGTTKEIFQLVKEGKIIAYASKEILDEFQNVLYYPKFADRLLCVDKTPKTLIDEFLEIVEYCSGEEFPISVVQGDPSDNKFLACTVACQADFVVSGDKHLLKIKKFQDIPIVPPSLFLKAKFLK